VSRAIGLDIGGTKLLAVRLDDDAVVDEYRTAKPDSGGIIVEEIVSAYRALADGEPIECLGVGIAGLVDHTTGTFVWGPHVDGIGIPVMEELEAALGLRAVVDNDANLAAFAEYRRGAGRGSTAMLMLTLGTGIGGAMVFDGRIYRGRGFAGEFGHARLAHGGFLCVCGQRGCWETEAAGPALERLAAEVVSADPGGSLARILGDGAPDGPAISRAASGGNPQALALVGAIGRAFGDGLAGVISMLDPDRVVIGGGLGSIGEILLDPIRTSAAAARYASAHKPLPDIVAAELGERAGGIGAALMAIEEGGRP